VDVRPSFHHFRTSITRDPIHWQGPFFFIETVCIISTVHKIGSPPCFHQKFLENNQQTLGDGRHPVANSSGGLMSPSGTSRIQPTARPPPPPGLEVGTFSFMHAIGINWLFFRCCSQCVIRSCGWSKLDWGESTPCCSVVQPGTCARTLNLSFLLIALMY